MTDLATLSARQYRLLDATSKLLGVALVAGGLEAGGSTPPGLALALAGVACATATVFLTHE
ncbi:MULTISPECIES: hypothetical protein [Haloarcula]|uniref:DUF8120 domain-containing protein n=1 Tax=Haloarcula pellucida TaxID=1427151 RepID=A0A830GIS5_9EURY|nr:MULTISPECIES: hypothetical protein [Halomicroarcula]MBX0347162.1 hypothetical protein [Halomicroarcula pellucida]MDS0276964.1 hypothetical protein [Halomicroarcula sp. S1AR25-4]GGN87296.1 hypothetical protein GCM10009030_05830 [Halomicroarcula pellucida]